jgi:hypothetical protein
MDATDDTTTDATMIVDVRHPAAEEIYARIIEHQPMSVLMAMQRLSQRGEYERGIAATRAWYSEHPKEVSPGL